MKRNTALAAIGTLAASMLAVASAVAPASAAHRPGGGPTKQESCKHRATLFCEDFEAVPVGGVASPNWDVNTRHGTLRVEKARHGNKVLHVHTEDNGMAFLTVNDFSAPGNSFYGRVRLKVDEFPSAPDWAHFTLIEATGSGSAEVVRPLGGQFAPTVGPKAIFWGVGADGGPTGDWTNWRESAPAVSDTWQCVEFAWSGAQDRISVWFDGVEQPDLEVDRTHHGGAATDFVLPQVNTVKVGWQLYQGGATPDHFDLWLDDIAFSSKRLGC